MRRYVWFWLFAIASIAAHAEEPAIKARVVSVGLFKNGLALIRAEAELPKAGTYLLEDVPDPVHGTWSVGADVPIEARIAARELLEPVHASEGLSLQESLAGRSVTIHFRDGQIPPATGKVEAVPEKKKPDEHPEADAYGRIAARPEQQRFLVLATDTGRIFVEPGMIAYLKAEGKEETQAKVKRSVLLLTAKGEGDKPIKINLVYMTSGMGWAPSYRVDISDPKTLSIEQNAVIRNELTDLNDSKIDLISGYPSIQFGRVTSLLSSHPSWTAFTDQLRRTQSGEGDDPYSYVQLQSNAYVARSNEHARINPAAPMAGEGVDIHYQPLGPRSLKKGESLSTSIAKESVEYERIIEWIVPDNRNEYGQYGGRAYGNRSSDEDAPWDAVRFRNPFKFPMTTAAASTFSGDRFLGQRMSTWVNPGEEACLQITKALSVRTTSMEHEENGAREELWIAGREYRRIAVTGEIKIKNHRKEDVKIVVRRQFSGELVKADGDPRNVLREEGVYSVNPRNELTWTVTVKSAEEKTLTYKYTVLVVH